MKAYSGLSGFGHLRISELLITNSTSLIIMN
ncbi:MAG: hypothetical protein ACI9EQ_001012 [Bacteroidia bacterium]